MNTLMLKNGLIFIFEFIFTFSFLGYNIQIGAGLYNWLAAATGGGMYYWLMYFDPDINNKAAAKVALMGPALAVILSPIICEYYKIPFDKSLAKGIYWAVAFLGLTITTFLYDTSKLAKKDGPGMFWRILKTWIPGTKINNTNADK